VDKLILGLLMLNKFTVYEIRGLINQFFKSMCSDSLGGIRAAVNKLFIAQMVTCSEYVERGVNKKQYAITDKGREEFLEWIRTPANVSLPKNMELGKLLFMGFVPTGNRMALVNEIISILENQLTALTHKQSAINWDKGKLEAIAIWENDLEYFEGIKMATQKADIAESAEDIKLFQMYSLQYEIDTTKFQIEWFTKLRNQEGSR